MVVPQSVLDSLKAFEGPGEFYFYPGNEGTLETWKKKWSMILLPVYQEAGINLRSHAWRDTLVFQPITRWSIDRTDSTAARPFLHSEHLEALQRLGS